MKISLSDVPIEHREKIAGLFTAAVKVIFEEHFNYNPIDEIVVAADFESTLQKYLKPEEARLRKIINEQKEVITIGKILPSIRKNQIYFTVLLHIAIFQSKEFQIRLILHEFFHVIDYIMLFSHLGEGIFADPPQPREFPTEEFYVWSEYHANRAAEKLATTFSGDHTEKTEKIYNIHDMLRDFIEKLRQARYSVIEQKKRNEIVEAALRDFFSLYLIYIGISAENSGLASQFEDFCNKSRFKDIFGESLIKMKELLEELYSLEAESLLKRLSEIKVFYTEAIANFNHFSVYGTY